MSGEPVATGPAPEKVSLRLRVGHLLRISSYLDIAVLAMWTGRRAEVLMGMAEASVKGYGPGGERGPDEKLLAKLRCLVGEAREYHAGNDFPAAMARMRVAQNLVDLRIVAIGGG